jgi:hypothetical protein
LALSFDLAKFFWLGDLFYPAEYLCLTEKTNLHGVFVFVAWGALLAFAPFVVEVFQ